jgi:putative aldouronate transport system substrate-binding protein
LFYGFGVADDWYLDGGKVTYGPITDKYKKALEWFHKLYVEGLLDKNYLTSNQDLYDKHLVQGMAAGFIDNTGQESRIMKLAADNGDPFKFVPIPYLKYNGKSVSLRSADKRLAQPYGLAIASTAENPAKIIKFLDYGYSKAGETLFNWGVKGKTFTVENGKKSFTDKVMKDPDYPPETALTKYTNPYWLTVTDPEAQKAVTGEFGIKARETWSKADSTMAMEPLLWMTDEENQVVQSATTDIETFHEEMRDAFITGKKDIDKQWDSYVQTLKSMGIERIQKAQQDAYDRFTEK